ncbi:MAG: response regulator [Planctomycetota bacterium]
MSGDLVLVVDDEAPIRAALQRLLRFDGHTVLMAADADEALELLRREPVSVVISDQQMPGMQGVDLLRAVRAGWPETSRILFSGHVDIELLRQAVNDGEVYRFITKPWDDDELRLAVRHGAERARLLRHNSQLQERSRQQNEDLKRFNASLSDLVEARTRDLEQRNRALLLNQDILDQLAVAVVGIDPGGLVVMVNAMARDLFPEAVPGQHCSEAMPPQLVAWITAVLAGDTTARQHQDPVGQLLVEAVTLDERGLVLSALVLPSLTEPATGCHTRE